MTVTWTPKQQAVIDELVDGGCDRVLLVGPVRAGKTYCVLHGYLTWLMEREGNHEVIIASASDRQLRQAVLHPIEQWCIDRGYEFATKRGPHYVITLPGEDAPKVKLWPLFGAKKGDEEKAKSYTVVGALIDEITDLTEEFVSSVEDRCSVPGAKIVAMCNPSHPEHWVKTRWVDGADALTVTYQFTLQDNPSLTERYIERLRDRYTGSQYRRLVLGEWAASTGLVFPSFHDQIRPDPLTAQIYRTSIGVDDAESGVLHAVLVAHLIDDAGRPTGCSHVLSECRYDGRDRGKLTAAQRANRIVNAFRHHGVQGDGVTARLSPAEGGMPYPSRVAVDPTATALIVELGKLLRCPVVKADNDVAQGLNYVNWLLEHDRLTVSLNGVPDLIREAGSYAWGERQMAVGEDRPVKENDHGIDALRYDLWTGTLHSAQPRRIKTRR